MGDEHEKNINTKNKGTQSWGANIFTAKSDELLETISFYTTDSSCNYEIYIYIDPLSGSTNQNDQVFPGMGQLQSQAITQFPLILIFG